MKPELAALPEGFSFHSHGREGSIFFRERGRVLEFYCEMPGVEDYDVLLWLDTQTWTLPAGEKVAESDRARIVAALEVWLAAKAIRTDAFAPIKRPVFPRQK